MSVSTTVEKSSILGWVDFGFNEASDCFLTERDTDLKRSGAE
jgi:hypothetical protein